MIPAVSIITVYYNSPEDIMKLSASMKTHLNPDTYEWLIVDNNSRLNLSSRLECTYLRQDVNSGFGAGCNIGAKHARGNALFFVNPDCEFIEDCITPMLKAFEHSQIVGPQVLYPDRSLQLSFGPLLSITGELKQKLLQRFERSKLIQSWLRNQAPRNPDYVSGCAMMIGSSEFRSLGGFDENFFLYHEDVDLCKRAREQGNRVEYLPEARIQHAKGTSAATDPLLVNLEYRKSQLHYYRKHHNSLQNSVLRTYLRIAGKMPANSGAMQ